MTLFADRHW